MTKSNRQRPSLGLILGLTAVAIIAGGTTAWFVLQNTSSPPSITSSPTLSPAATVVDKLEIYWLKVNEQSFEVIPTMITVEQADASPEVALKVGLQRLLAGSANADVTSAIPEGTTLNSVEIKSDGVHLDLSKQFVQGGGSLSMQGRLGQIIYTASSLNPQAKVWISIAGEPLTVLGGEGLEVNQPITRQQFKQDFQAKN